MLGLKHVIIIAVVFTIGFAAATSTIGLPEDCEILGEQKQDAKAGLDAYETVYAEQHDLTFREDRLFREKLLELREQYIAVSNAHIACLEK